MVVTQGVFLLPHTFVLHPPTLPPHQRIVCFHLGYFPLTSMFFSSTTLLCWATQHCLPSLGGLTCWTPLLPRRSSGICSESRVKSCTTPPRGKLRRRHQRTEWRCSTQCSRWSYLPGHPGTWSTIIIILIEISIAPCHWLDSLMALHSETTN